MSRSSRFDFKRLDVYEAALDFFTWAAEVSGGISWRHRAVGDQLIKAANSILGNLGEASGRRSMPKESRQHYRYALGSDHECAAYLDALLALGVIDEEARDEREDQLARIGSMISRLMAHQSRKRRGNG